MHHGIRRQIRAALIVGALAVALGAVWVMPSLAASFATRTAVPVAGGPVTTATSKVTAGTLAASLRPLAAEGGSQKVDVLVILAKGSARPQSLEYAVRVRLRALADVDVYAGKVAAKRLDKLATSRGVRFVADNGSRKPPPQPETPDKAAPAAAALQAKAAGIAAATRNGSIRAWARGFGRDGLRKAGAVLPAAPPVSAGDTAIRKLLGVGDPAPTPGSKYSSAWFDVRENHRSSYAWARGWTGAGVRVALPDEGVDFAHPDLQGTEATVPASVPEYAGWPLAFDPFSCYALAVDDQFGTHYVDQGLTWFSSTTATVPVSAEATFGGQRFKTDTIPTPSLSGVIHIGFLNDQNVGEFSPTQGYYRPAVAIVDANSPGVYDTVYVDLNFDRDFGDDKPCTKGGGDAPIAYLDFWDSARQTAYPDGYADVSGGMVYWIADGHTAPPGYTMEFGSMNTTPGAGNMVAFMGALDYGADHGTLCGSNVVGQGVINGPSYIEGPASIPPFKGAGTGGMVQGGGRDAKLVGIGDIYKNFQLSAMMSWDFAAVGPDGIPGSGDESQICSNSFGTSEVSDSEWDLMSRYMVALNRVFAPTTTFLTATGNGGPGYGTITAPKPTTGIGVGASTQYGSISSPLDSAVSTDQITYGDVAPFSDRGPSAMGHNGVDVVADGSIGSGDEPLNMSAGDGWTAWAGWSGTSRSTPTAAGNLALVYQAYAGAHGGAWPTYDAARGFLMNGATDCSYDTLVQGAGRVNAERSGELAAGTEGLSVSPSALSPGSWKGAEYPGYASVIPTGGSAPATLTVTNNAGHPVTVHVEPSVYARTKTTTFSVELDPAKMSAYRFDRPDWISGNLRSQIPTGTDLVVFRVRTPVDSIDPHGTLGDNQTNGIRALVYDWTDVNHDGVLWQDLNGNGFVNDPGYGGPEIQSGEYVRFAYANNTGPTTEVRVADPLGRSHDGVYFGLQLAQVPMEGILRLGNTLPVTVEMSCWQRTTQTDLLEVTSTDSFGLGSGASAPVRLLAHAPEALGTYEASVRVSDGTTTTVVPVTVNAAASSAEFTFGGGADTTGTLMPNGALLGMQDWSWRAEAGDWRMFMADVPASTQLPPGAKWAVHTSWDATPTDMDTRLWGPAPAYGPPAAPPFFLDPAYTDYVGPGELGSTGGSINQNVGYGVWLFNTATGGPSEWVTGDLQPGLNMLQLHNVISSGASAATTFSGETGVMGLDPGTTAVTTKATSGSYDMHLFTSMGLQAFNGRGWGLSPVFDRFEKIAQDGYWTRDFTVTDAGYIDVKTFDDTSDIDLILYYNDPARGLVPVAISAGATGNESIHVVKPRSGAYEVEVYGYDVPTGTDRFRVRIAAPQGHGLPVTGFPTGSIPPGTSMTAHASWTVSRQNLDERDATYEGIAGFGPGEANQLLAGTIDVSYPFYVANSAPAAGAVWSRTSPLTADLSRRANPLTVTGDTVYVTLRGSAAPIRGIVTYDDATARITVTGTALARNTDYTLHVTSGVTAVDGTALPETSIPFRANAAMTARVAGSDRYDTALKAARSAFATATAAVVAPGWSYPDALSASGLCGALRAPLILSSPDAMPAGSLELLGSLGVRDVYVVGAVTPRVFAQLWFTYGAGHTFRITGSDRYATAAAVATSVASIEGTAPVALVTRGDDFADALAAAPMAYARKAPVLFVQPNSLPAATSAALTALGTQRAYVFGGTGAISSGVADGIGQIVGSGHVTRWAGADRYATAVMAANGAGSLGWLDWSYPSVATGTDYPDGLAGGVATGVRRGPLLLTQPAALPPVVSSAVSAHKGAIRTVTIYGGTGAASTDVQNQLENLLK